MSSFSGLSEIDKRILMELQYNFPLTTNPFEEVALRLDLSLEKLLARLKQLKKHGILKRIGFYINYRSQRKKAALVALAVEGDHSLVSTIAAKDPSITHCFLRRHPIFNIWIVVKKDTVDSLVRHVERLANEIRAKKTIILFSKRTFKLSVKYDLYKEISRSGPYALLPEDNVSIEKISVPWSLIKELHNIPLEVNPYRRIMEEYGMSKEELELLIRELLSMGVIADPGASLDGWKLGFTENVLLAADPNDCKNVCKCLAESPYTTHVVLREPYQEPSWKYTCYAMVHSRSRKLLEELLWQLESRCNCPSFLRLYSVLDLKPGVIR